MDLLQCKINGTGFLLYLSSIGSYGVVMGYDGKEVHVTELCRKDAKLQLIVIMLVGSR